MQTEETSWPEASVIDFNKDGTSDILLQNGGQIVQWTIQSGYYQSGNVVTTGLTGYSIVGTGDFNGDGTTDILLQNGGQVVQWTMQNGYYQSGNVVATGLTGYTIAGTGDFDGDGTTDIVLQGTGDHTSEIVVWSMKNGRYASSISNNDHVGAVGQVVSTGDFNGDGTTDILTQNYITGENSAVILALIMKNGQTQYNSAISQGSAGFSVVGTGDFNGDGTTDVLLQNGDNIVVWIIQNGHYAYGNTVSSNAAGFKVVATGDYNGDGTTDILLQNGGTLVEWMMLAGQYAGGHLVSSGTSGYSVFGT